MHPAVWGIIAGAALALAGIMLRGKPELGIPLVGVGIVLCIACVVRLCVTKGAAKCPHCGALIQTGKGSLYELSRTGTLTVSYTHLTLPTKRIV